MTVEEIQTKIRVKEVKEDKEQQVKARKQALRGKVGFAKLVWKEMPVSPDLFD